MLDTQPAATPVEVVTPIKPSEALRLGRLVRPRHCTGGWFSGEHAACALGAIYIGWGGDPAGIHQSGEPLNEVEHVFLKRLADAGVSGWQRGVVGTIGTDLFDAAERNGRDGDAAVLAYLEARGL